jgi:hypothetical protein
MLEMTTRSWCIREVYEENWVDFLWSCHLFESGAVGVNMEERVSGRK